MTARERTGLLAMVETEAEAGAARDAGADLVCLAGRPPMPSMLVLGADAGARLGEIDGARMPGRTAAMIDTGTFRLLDAVAFSDLSAFAETCRSAGLDAVFAGNLEAPDIPRLLPLRPAFLGFREAIRDGGGALDLAALRDLSRQLRAPDAPAAATHSDPDRVYIRDFVVEMELGAYGSERGRRQRVGFSLEAEIAPVDGPRSLADIYSYDRMMDAVRAIAARPREAFVETLAEDLAAEILSDPRLLAVTVRVEKLDLGPAAAGIEIRRTRG